MYFQHYIYISDTLYENSFDEKISSNAITVDAGNQESFLNDIAKLKDVSFTNNYASIIKDFGTMIQALNYIIVVIIAVAGALAFVVLMNLTQVNISERIICY